MPEDPTPAELAAMPLRQWRELERTNPGVIEHVFAGLREQDEAPQRAREAAERATRAAGDEIARDPALTALYIDADRQRRAARSEHAAAEVRRLRPAESFPIPSTEEGA